VGQCDGLEELEILCDVTFALLLGECIAVGGFLGEDHPHDVIPAHQVRRFFLQIFCEIKWVRFI
jgi:hypothetical protein